MQKNRSFGEKFEAFFAGKGFYIVLFLCVAVIGVSAWVIVAGTGTDVENNSISGVMQAPEENVISVTPGNELPVILDEPSQDKPVSSIPDSEEDAQQTIAEQPVVDVSVPEEPVPVFEQEASLFVWPLNGDVSTPYSVTALIYNRTMQDWRTHDGVDIAAELGTQVMAVSSGTVEEIYYDDLYGTTVVISHVGGVRSIYSNLAETPTVNIGDSVSTGEIIGAVGDTALAETGESSHLHLSMSVDGISTDPAEYLPYR